MILSKLKNKKIINADINRALNIMTKNRPDSCD